MTAIRRVLKDFLCQMEYRLRENDKRPGWCNYTKGDLIEKIRYKIDELEDELLSRNSLFDDDPDKEKITKKASDLANLAMMVSDNWGEK